MGVNTEKLNKLKEELDESNKKDIIIEDTAKELFECFDMNESFNKNFEEALKGLDKNKLSYKVFSVIKNKYYEKPKEAFKELRKKIKEDSFDLEDFDLKKFLENYKYKNLEGEEEKIGIEELLLYFTATKRIDKKILEILEKNIEKEKIKLGKVIYDKYNQEDKDKLWYKNLKNIYNNNKNNNPDNKDNEIIFEDNETFNNPNNVEDITKKTAEALVDIFNFDTSTINTGEIHQKYSDEVISEKSRKKYENRKTTIGKMFHSITDRRRQKKLNKKYQENIKNKGITIHNQNDDTLQKKISSTASYASNTDKSGLGKNIYENINTYESKELNKLAQEYYKTKNKSDLEDNVNDLFRSSTDPEIQKLKEDYKNKGIKEREIGGNIVEQIVNQVESKRNDIDIFYGILNGDINSKNELKSKLKSKTNEKGETKLPGFIIAYMQTEGIDEIDNIDFNDLNQILKSAKSSSVCNQLAEGNNKFRVKITAYKTNKIKNLGAVEIKKGKGYKIGRFFAKMGLVENIGIGILLSSAIAFSFPAGVFATSIGMLGYRAIRNMLKKGYEQTKEVNDLYNKYVGEGNIDDLKNELQKYKDIIDGDIAGRKKVLSRISGFGKYNEAKKKVSIISSVLEKTDGSENSLLKISDLKNNLKQNEDNTEDISKILSLRDAQIKTGRQFIASDSIENAESQRLELQEEYKKSVINLVDKGKLGDKSDLLFLENKNHSLYTQTRRKYNNSIRKEHAYKNTYKSLVEGDEKWLNHFKKEKRKEIFVKGGQTLAVGATMIGVSGALHGIYEHFRGHHDGIDGETGETIPNKPSHGGNDHEFYDGNHLDDSLLKHPSGEYNYTIRTSINGDTTQDISTIANNTKSGAIVNFNNIHSGVSYEPAGQSFVNELNNIHNQINTLINSNPELLSNGSNLQKYINENLPKWIEYAKEHGADNGNAALAQTRKLEPLLKYLQELNKNGTENITLNFEVDEHSDLISQSGHRANDSLNRCFYIGDVQIDNPSEIPVEPVIPVNPIENTNSNFSGMFIPIERGTYGPVTSQYLLNQQRIKTQKTSKKRFFNKKQKNNTDEFSSSLSQNEVTGLLNEIKPGSCIYNNEENIKDEKNNSKKIPKGNLIVIGIGNINNKKTFRVVGDDGKEYFISRENVGNGLLNRNISITESINEKKVKEIKEKIDLKNKKEIINKKVEEWKNNKKEIDIVLIDDIKNKNGKNIEKGNYIIQLDQNDKKFNLYKQKDFTKGEKIGFISPDNLKNGLLNGKLTERKYDEKDLENIDAKIKEINKKIEEKSNKKEKEELGKQKKELETKKEIIEKSLENREKTQEKEFVENNNTGGTGKQKEKQQKEFIEDNNTGGTGKKGKKTKNLLNTATNRKNHKIKIKTFLNKIKKGKIESKNQKLDAQIKSLEELGKIQKEIIEELGKQEGLLTKKQTQIEQNKKERKQTEINNIEQNINYIDKLSKIIDENIELQNKINERIKQQQNVIYEKNNKENEENRIKTINEQIKKSNNEFNKQIKKLQKKQIKLLKKLLQQELKKNNKIKIKDNKIILEMENESDIELLELNNKVSNGTERNKKLKEFIGKRKEEIDNLEKEIDNLKKEIDSLDTNNLSIKESQKRMEELQKKTKKLTNNVKNQVGKKTLIDKIKNFFTKTN